jgi:hypothetical protein
MLIVFLDVPLDGAVAAGKTAAGLQQIKLTDEHLAGYTVGERAVLAAYLHPTKGATPIGQQWTGVQPAGLWEATPETLLECVRAQRAHDAERAAAREAERVAYRARREEQRVEAMAAPLPALVVRRSDYRGAWYTTNLADALTDRGEGNNTPLPATAAHRARFAEAVAEAARLTVEDNAAHDRAAAEVRTRDEAERAAEEERERRIALAVAVWIATHGTRSQKTRFAAGVLPDAEVWNAIRARVFSPMGDAPRFEKLTPSNLRHFEGHWEHEMSTSSTGGVHLSEEQHAALERLRPLAHACDPTATVEPRTHTILCTCGAWVARYGALVAVSWFGRPLSREYALPDAPVLVDDDDGDVDD